MLYMIFLVSLKGPFLFLCRGCQNVFYSGRCMTREAFLEVFGSFWGVNRHHRLEIFPQFLMFPATTWGTSGCSFGGLSCAHESACSIAVGA